MNRLPTIARVLETALYVDDLGRAMAFYRDILGLRVLDTSPRLVVIDAGQATILLLFRRGGHQGWARTSSGWIPPHDGQGPAHVAFAVDPGQIAVWEEYLLRNGVMIRAGCTGRQAATASISGILTATPLSYEPCMVP